MIRTRFVVAFFVSTLNSTVHERSVDFERPVIGENISIKFTFRKMDITNTKNRSGPEMNVPKDTSSNAGDETEVFDLLSKAVVIIPVLNEEDSIGLVLDDLPSVGKVIVCDNGSTDRSAEIAREKGAFVVHQPQRGYGAACLRGLQQARSWIEAGEDLEFVAFIDGDYSDHPEQLSDLADCLLSQSADFVVGSRMTGNREKGAMPLQSTFGNRLACFLMWLFWKAKYTDLGPFRLIRWRSIEQLKMNDQNFGWTVEMQIKAVENGLKCAEIPVGYRRRIGRSKISGTIIGSFRAGYKILWTIFKYRFLPRRNA